MVLLTVVCHLHDAQRLESQLVEFKQVLHLRRVCADGNMVNAFARHGVLRSIDEKKHRCEISHEQLIMKVRKGTFRFCSLIFVP